MGSVCSHPLRRAQTWQVVGEASSIRHLFLAAPSETDNGANSDDEPELESENDSDVAVESDAETERAKRGLSLFDQVMRRRHVVLAKGLASMLFRALDTGLDFRTAFRFFSEGHVKFAVLTISFVLVSPVMQCTFVYFKCRRCSVSLPFLVPASLEHLRREYLQVDLVRRLPQAALYQNVHILAGANPVNEALAGIECFFESLPQACIQTYAMYLDKRKHSDFLNYASLAFSFIGVMFGIFFGIRAVVMKSIARVGAKVNAFGHLDEQAHEVHTISAAGDTLSPRGIYLSRGAIDVLTDFTRRYVCTFVWEMSETGCVDKDVAKISQACPWLQSFNVSDCGGITDDGLRKLTANCTNLISVDFGACSKITDSGLRQLAES